MSALGASSVALRDVGPGLGLTASRLSQDESVSRWCVVMKNAIDPAHQLWRALRPHAGGHAEAARDQQEIALIPNEAATNEQC